jgi:hypothetical protein
MLSSKETNHGTLPALQLYIQQITYVHAALYGNRSPASVSSYDSLHS